MKPKEIAKNFLTAQADHHAKMARAHQTAADASEEDDKESPWATFHQAAAASHTTMGEQCVAMCQECEKVSAVDFGKAELTDDQIIPSQVSGVAPEPAGGGVRMVLRTGQTDHSAASKTQQPAGSFDFSKLHAIEE